MKLKSQVTLVLFHIKNAPCKSNYKKNCVNKKTSHHEGTDNISYCSTRGNSSRYSTSCHDED